VTKKIGRPTKRTKKLEEELLLWVSEGKTIRAFCREHKINSATIYNWTTSDARLSQRLACAREVGEMMIEGELQEIADTPTDHRDDVAHRKLQCWAREKRLVWSNPGRYGSKTQIGGAVGLPPVQLTDTERMTRIQQLIDKANGGQPRITVEENNDDDRG